ncbi:NUDIX hydrolase N-terminal domain-containing protein [Acetobacteraceae bacterium KSS8]|uniref:NUDIX hydrolase N-terminal domain-containing protein n=1 Tax=Endosaccharibacter trunci TaxID=2812733 RepID=A0ABT1W3V7_9PROT|nr:NUDIX hydrolase N-terminal domain-containing protein [Acetobacteraceae bacterium KSS8]
MNDEPEWLVRARAVQALAQSGLAFTRDPYDRERYEALTAIAAQMMAGPSGADPDALRTIFEAERGYATPKLDVRGAVFDAEGRLLMVRELADEGRWTLPGGWADVNQTASECAVREVLEESGYRVRAAKLALVHDRARQGHHPAGPFSICKLFFLCTLLSPEPERLDGNIETADARFFAEAEIPDDLSTGRVLPHQIARLFAHRAEPGLPTEFD